MAFSGRPGPCAIPESDRVVTGPHAEMQPDTGDLASQAVWLWSPPCGSPGLRKGDPGTRLHQDSRSLPGDLGLNL